VKIDNSILSLPESGSSDLGVFRGCGFQVVTIAAGWKLILTFLWLF